MVKIYNDAMQTVKLYQHNECSLSNQQKIIT